MYKLLKPQVKLSKLQFKLQFKAGLIFRHSADPPFIRSIMLSNNSRYRISQLVTCSLRGPFWHKSPIQIVKCSFIIEKISSKPTWCADHIYWDISARKNLDFNYASVDATVKLFLDVYRLSQCHVRQELKKMIGSIKLLDLAVKYALFKKQFPRVLWYTDHTN